MDNSMDIRNALTALQNGGVIIYPTDTIWGIGCNATNEAAVEKIYQLKGRDPQKPLLVIVNSIEKIKLYKNDLSELEIKALLSNTPTTVILENINGLANNLYGPQKSIGFRISTHEFCKQICEALDKPLVSTSANLSGEPAAKKRTELNPVLIQSADYTVRDWECALEKPSRIVKYNGNELQIIRP